MNFICMSLKFYATLCFFKFGFLPGWPSQADIRRIQYRRKSKQRGCCLSVSNIFVILEFIWVDNFFHQSFKTSFRGMYICAFMFNKQNEFYNENLRTNKGDLICELCTVHLYWNVENRNSFLTWHVWWINNMCHVLGT